MYGKVDSGVIYSLTGGNNAWPRLVLTVTIDEPVARALCRTNSAHTSTLWIFRVESLGICEGAASRRQAS